MSRTLTSFRPSAAIAAVIVAGAVLASCSSGSTTRQSYPAGSPEAAVSQTADDYLAAVSSGEVDALVAVSCKKIGDTVPEDATDSPSLEQPIVVDNVANIKIDGDTATADVTASLEGSPDVEPQKEALVFVNEDGWKICN